MPDTPVDAPPPDPGQGSQRANSRIDTSVSMKMDSLTLFFRDRRAEKEFTQEKYGKRFNWLGVFVCSVVGTLFFFVYTIFDFFDEKVGLLWSITDVISLIWVLLVGLLNLVPWVVRRPYLVDFLLCSFLLFADVRSQMFDVLVDGIASPFTPLKVNLVNFAGGISLRPRFFPFAIQSILGATFFSVSCLFYSLGRDSYDTLVLQASYWFQQLLLLSFLRIINWNSRLLFRARRRLEIQEKKIREENRRTRLLLLNTLPSRFISLIEDGSLDTNGMMLVREEGEERKDDDDDCSTVVSLRRENTFSLFGLEQSVGCIIEELSFAGLLECDIVGFTSWSRTVDSGVCTRILNLYYTLFDVIVDELSVEKVATLGDAFVCFVPSGELYGRLLLSGIGMIEAVRIVNAAANRRWKSSQGSGSSTSLSSSSSTSSLLSCPSESDLVEIDLTLRVAVCCGKTLHLAVQGSSQSSISFNAFGDLYFETVAMESKAVPNSIRMNREFAESIQDDFELTSSNCLEDDESTNDVMLMFDDECREWEDFVVSEALEEDLNTALGSAALVLQMRRKFDANDNLDLSKVIFEQGGGGGEKEARSEWSEGEEKSDEEGKGQGLWSRMKKGAKLYCSVTSGLIYPLATFKSWSEEISCLYSSYERHRHFNSFWFLFPFVTNILFLLVNLASFGGVDDLANPSPHVISLYVCCAYELIVFLLLLIYDFIAMFPWWLYLCIFHVHLALFLASSVLSVFYGPSSVSFRQIYIASAVVFIVWESSLTFLGRVVFFALDLCVVVLDLAWNDLPEDHAFQVVMTALLYTVVFFMSGYLKDISAKLAYVRCRECEERSLRLNEQKSRNVALLNSALPKDILDLLFQHRGHSFTSKMTELYCCFLTVRNIYDLPIPKKSGSSAADEGRSLRRIIMFLTRLHSAFDERLNDDQNESSCLKVKSFQEGYIFLSREQGMRGLVSSMDFVRECCEVFSRSLSFLTNDFEDEKVIDDLRRRIVLVGGISFGSFHSGVFGRQRLAFDILGSSVNLSARLCYSCEAPFGVQASVENLRTALDDDVREGVVRWPLEMDGTRIDETGEVELKGFGTLRCVTLLPSVEAE